MDQFTFENHPTHEPGGTDATALGGFQAPFVHSWPYFPAVPDSSLQTVDWNLSRQADWYQAHIALFLPDASTYPTAPLPSSDSHASQNAAQRNSGACGFSSGSASVPQPSPSISSSPIGNGEPQAMDYAMSVATQGRIEESTPTTATNATSAATDHPSPTAPPRRRRGRPRLYQTSEEPEEPQRCYPSIPPLSSRGSSSSFHQRRGSRDQGTGGTSSTIAAAVRTRNREAAMRYRNKIHTSISQLEDDERKMAALHKSLLAYCGQLTEEVYQLKNQLLLHGNCDCPVIQRYLRESVQRSYDSRRTGSA